MSRVRLCLAYCFLSVFGLGAWVGPSAHSGAPSAPDRTRAPPGAPEEAPRPGDRCRVCATADRLGLVMTPLYRPVIHRCAGPTPVAHAVRPRGVVTASLLTHVRLDLGEAILAQPGIDTDAPLQLEMRLGDAVLGRFAVRLDAMTRRIPVPPALQARLRGVRGCVTWGVFGLDEPLARAPIWIEEPQGPAARRLAAVEHGLAREPLWVRHVVRGQAWLDQEHALRALDEAGAALALQPAEPHALALRLLCQERLRMRTTLGWVETLEALHGMRGAVRAPGCRLDEPLAPRQDAQHATLDPCR